MYIYLCGGWQDATTAMGIFKRCKAVQAASAKAKSAADTRQFEKAVELYTTAIETAEMPTHAPVRVLVAGTDLDLG